MMIQPTKAGSEDEPVRTSSLRPRRAALSAGIVSFALLAGACAGSATNSAAPTIPSVEESEPSAATTATTPAEVDPEEAMRDYDQCLAENGVEVPEPGEEGIVTFDVTAGPDSDFEAAMAACESILEDAFGEFELDPEQAAEFADQELEFARCMRENGVADWPDPTGDPGAVMTMEFEGDLNQDDLNTALSTCAEETYGSAAIDGEGGSSAVIVP